jgi:hypothetical protein
MITVLEIVQSALDELGLPNPTSILSTTDPTEKQCRRILQAAATFARNQRAWPQLKKQGSLTLVDARYQYPLPSDYYAALPGTQWDDNNQCRLIGPIGDANWTDRTKGNDEEYTAFRIFGPDLNPSSTSGQIKINPTPTTADAGTVLSYEYVIRSLYVKSDYSAYYEVVNADGDYCLLDDDYMVAEFKWRYLRAKKKDYAQEKADADAMLDAAVARWKGSRIGSMLNEGTGPRYSVPDGGWPF